MNIQILNELSADVNSLYGFVELKGDNFGEPCINSGPCGPFANAFLHSWNERFDEKVNIVFIMVKDSDECWHVLIRLPNGMLFDGGIGIHDEDHYADRFEIHDMYIYDLKALEKHSGGLDRKYPRYCPDFKIEEVNALITKHLDKMKEQN